MKKLILILLCITLTLSLTSCEVDNMTEEEKQQEGEIMKLVIKEDFTTARNKAKKYYKDDKEKLEETLDYINEYEEGRLKIRAAVNPLQIQDGWKWEVEGDYSYVQGRVKNISTKNIGYFEVTAEYLDAAGNVLDTDYTNSGKTIKPGDMKEFEIMHKHKSEYKTVQIYTNNIK